MKMEAPKFKIGQKVYYIKREYACSCGKTPGTITIECDKVLEISAYYKKHDRTVYYGFSEDIDDFIVFQNEHEIFATKKEAEAVLNKKTTTKKVKSKK